MTLREDRNIDGITCDATGCRRVFEMPCLPFFDALDYIHEYAPRARWTCWVGRGQRHYCPSHGPKPGHKMRLLWGTQPEPGETP